MTDPVRGATLGARPPGLPPTVFVHPLALVETTEIGPGTRVWGFAHVMNGAHVGSDCNLGGHVFVEAGARVGNRVTVKNGISLWSGVEVADDVFLGPHAIFTNDPFPRAFIKKGPEALARTRIGRGATIGAGAVILCGLSIGEYAFVAAGSVVTKDVPPHALVKGNPAKITSLVCACGKTRGAAGGRPPSCPSCGGNAAPGS